MRWFLYEIFCGIVSIICTSGCQVFRGVPYDKYNDGERKYYATKLLGIAADGLSKFNEVNGRYPSIDGKYFFDSIKVYLDEDFGGDEFQFVFVTEYDRFGRLERIVGEPSKNILMRIDSCYLAVWQAKSYISYVRPTKEGDKPMLYWVGLNWQDEKGEGDDVVYEVK